jgi:uncharacterized protein (TIGR02118 family)
MRHGKGSAAMIRISAIYPNEAGSRFDSADYLGRHEPLARSLLGPHGLLEIRSTVGVASLDGTPPAYWAISELFFTSRGQFDAAIAECGEAVFADIPNYTSVTPILQISTMVGDEPDPA